MELSTWLSLVTICILGAMSPGPSIAIILQITARSGRNQGMLAALAHGLGVGCYAAVAAAGLAVVIAGVPGLFAGLQYLGALFLAYLGLTALGLSSPFVAEKQPAVSAGQQPFHQSSSTNNFTIGFLTAFLNPKVALFFIALFSQFVRDDSGVGEKIIMATTVAVIDGLWYCTVAVVASGQILSSKLSRYGKLFEKFFGVILIALAIRVAFG